MPTPQLIKSIRIDNFWTGTFGANNLVQVAISRIKLYADNGVVLPFKSTVKLQLAGVAMPVTVDLRHDQGNVTPLVFSFDTEASDYLELELETPVSVGVVLALFAGPDSALPVASSRHPQWCTAWGIDGLKNRPVIASPAMTNYTYITYPANTFYESDVGYQLLPPRVVSQTIKHPDILVNATTTSNSGIVTTAYMPIKSSASPTLKRWVKVELPNLSAAIRAVNMFHLLNIETGSSVYSLAGTGWKDLEIMFTQTKMEEAYPSMLWLTENLAAPVKAYYFVYNATTSNGFNIYLRYNQSTATNKVPPSAGSTQTSTAQNLGTPTAFGYNFTNAIMKVFRNTYAYGGATPYVESFQTEFTVGEPIYMYLGFLTAASDAVFWLNQFQSNNMRNRTGLNTGAIASDVFYDYGSVNRFHVPTDVNSQMNTFRTAIDPNAFKTLSTRQVVNSVADSTLPPLDSFVETEDPLGTPLHNRANFSLHWTQSKNSFGYIKTKLMFDTAPRTPAGRKLMLINMTNNKVEQTTIANEISGLFEFKFLEVGRQYFIVAYDDLNGWDAVTYGPFTAVPMTNIVI